MFQLHFQISFGIGNTAVSKKECKSISKERKKVRFNLYQRSYCLKQLHLKQSLNLHIYCIELFLQVDIFDGISMLDLQCLFGFHVYWVSISFVSVFFSLNFSFIFNGIFVGIIITFEFAGHGFLSDLNDVCSTTGVVNPCVEFVKVHLVILYKFIGQQWNLEFQCVLINK